MTQTILPASKQHPQSLAHSTYWVKDVETVRQGHRRESVFPNHDVVPWRHHVMSTMPVSSSYTHLLLPLTPAGARQCAGSPGGSLFLPLSLSFSFLFLFYFALTCSANTGKAISWFPTLSCLLLRTGNISLYTTRLTQIVVRQRRFQLRDHSGRSLRTEIYEPRTHTQIKWKPITLDLTTSGSHTAVWLVDSCVQHVLLNYFVAPFATDRQFVLRTFCSEIFQWEKTFPTKNNNKNLSEREKDNLWAPTYVEDCSGRARRLRSCLRRFARG